MKEHMSFLKEGNSRKSRELVKFLHEYTKNTGRSDTAGNARVVCSCSQI